MQYGKTDRTPIAGVIVGSAPTPAAHHKRPNWLLKLDWNINDNNILEFTGVLGQAARPTPITTTPALTPARDASREDYRRYRITPTNGGELYVLKYTGYLTDTFTLSALAGHGDLQAQ